MQDQPIPVGFCQCGCGQRTKLAPQTQRSEGLIKGQPRRFLRGHNGRPPVDYRIDDETGCWVWLKSLQRNGYGHGYDPDVKRQVPAHRVYYKRFVGPIPKGFHIDHLCRNRACVNPAHLEAVTVTENNRRAFFGRRINGQFQREQEPA